MYTDQYIRSTAKRREKKGDKNTRFSMENVQIQVLKKLVHPLWLKTGESAMKKKKREKETYEERG